MKIHWTYFIIAGFILGLLVKIPGCERDPEVIKEIDTVETVTIKLMQLDPIAVDIPEPEKVYPYVPPVPDPPDYSLDQLRTYIDTALFDGLSLAYTITTRGELQSAIFQPTFELETITNTITITNTEKEKAKPLRGLYVGLNVGGNKTQFGTLAPQLDYVNQKNIFRANYNLIDQTINIGISRRIF